AQMVRLCLILVGVLSALLIGMKLLSLSPSPPPVSVAARSGPLLPEPDQCRKLSSTERKEVTRQLRELALKLGLRPSEILTAEGLLTEIDEHLGTPPNRDCGPIHDIKPLERRLRALLWKQDIPEYKDLRYNLSELVERLQKKVLPRTPDR